MFWKSVGMMRGGGTPPAILLSFDVEEFDIPLEYGWEILVEEQLRVGGLGLETVLALLDRHGVVATLFTTARFALAHERLMRRAAERHEIASHGMSHDRFEPGDLSTSRAVLERITRAPVRGFRRPRFEPTDAAAVREAGYVYNSSENPILLPGRYNNLGKPRTAYITDGLVQIPISATPVVRFPLFWLSFKNAPIGMIRAASRACLRWDGYLSLVFHPWEFVDLGRFRLPQAVKRVDGRALVRRLEDYLAWLSPRGKFMTYGDFAQASALPPAPAPDGPRSTRKAAQRRRDIERPAG